jgi:hypothetical protein
MNICRDCKFWKGHHDDNPLPPGWGYCRVAELNESLAVGVEFVSDGTDRNPAGPPVGRIRTHARFGCNQFEPDPLRT